jgi:hypothetical protein
MYQDNKKLIKMIFNKDYNKKKAQAGLEFVLLVSFVLFVFILVFYSISNQITIARDKQQLDELARIGIMLDDEITRAKYVRDGYLRYFEVPLNINNMDFNVSVNPLSPGSNPTDSNNSEVVFTLDERYASNNFSIVKIYPNITINLSKGLNIINKTDGKIVIEPLDYDKNPVYCSMGDFSWGLSGEASDSACCDIDDSQYEISSIYNNRIYKGCCDNKYDCVDLSFTCYESGDFVDILKCDNNDWIFDNVYWADVYDDWNCYCTNGDECSSWWEIVGDSIRTTTNIQFFSAFYTKRKYDQFDLEVILSSSNSDNDNIGVVLAIKEDEFGDIHTLTAFRGGNGVDSKDWYVLYDMDNSYSNSANIIADKSTTVTPSSSTGWYGAETKVSAIRNGDIITIKTSNWDDPDNYVASSEIVIDLNSDPRLELFAGGASFGFGVFSQQYSTFNNLTLENLHFINEITLVDKWMSQNYISLNDYITYNVKLDESTINRKIIISDGPDYETSNIICQSGYSISPTLSCIGHMTDDTIDKAYIAVCEDSECVKRVSAFDLVFANKPFSENFEDAEYTFNNVDYDDYDWTMPKSGSTGSSGTGPTSAIEGTYYAYTEASGIYGEFVLESNLFYFTNNGQVSFNYHAYSQNYPDLYGGYLRLQIYDGLTWNTLWEVNTNQGSNWQSQIVDISAYKNTETKLRFLANTEHFQNDFSLDNIQVTFS